MVDTIDYQSIRKQLTKLGKEDIVKERAKQLQHQLRDGEDEVPFKDAYEMAYNEIIIGNRHRYF